MKPVDYIEPVDGWVLMEELYDYEWDRYPTPWYEAHHPEKGVKVLQTSGYSFSPTQERFEWLIKQPNSRRQMVSYRGDPYTIPWDDESIDAAIESERDLTS